MRWWLAYFLHRVAYKVFPADDEEEVEAPESPIHYVMELPHGPKERSEPLDAQWLWREQVYDNQSYIEENDVYRPGTYL